MAFCASFPSGTANPASSRSGQTNGTLWGTSVVTGSPGNPTANVQPGSIDDGSQSTACSSSSMVSYSQNVRVCDGALQETTNDGGEVSSMAMYPKQPFDFANRTGTIVFDVSNNSQGSHAAWPELWVSDQPVPDPFTHEASWQAFPRNGFGIRFAGCTDSTGTEATCSQGSPGSLGVDSAVVVNNYVGNDSFMGGGLQVIGYGSVKVSQPGQMNHYEVQVSQNQLVVYGTNPFSGTWNPSTNPLIHLATIPNANLSFTRGLVWLEDVHYNGDKFNNQRVNTFQWNNIGFDGPVLPRDLAFDVPDNTTPVSNVNGTGTSGVDTAYVVQPNSSMNLTVPNVTGVSQASGALLTFNFYPEGVAPITLNVAVNGHAISVPWPYPDNTVDSPRTIAVTVPLADVTTGNNTLTFSSGNYNLDVMNIDLIMEGAGGTVNPS